MRSIVSRVDVIDGGSVVFLHGTFDRVLIQVVDSATASLDASRFDASAMFLNWEMPYSRQHSSLRRGRQREAKYTQVCRYCIASRASIQQVPRYA